MLTVYTIHCRIPDVGILRNCLRGMANIYSSTAAELSAANPPPELVFVGAFDKEVDWSEEEDVRQARMTQRLSEILARVRTALAFKDVPIVLLVDKSSSVSLQNPDFRGKVSAVLSAPIERAGLLETINTLMRPAGEATQIDAQLVNPFAKATVEVLQTMADTKAQRTGLFLKKDYRLFGEFSAVIGIVGKTVEGSIAITFHEALARGIVGRMVQSEPESLSVDEVEDGIGELVNMIVGHAKQQLSEADHMHFEVALPTMVSGMGFEIVHSSGIPCLVLVFEAEGMPFALQIVIGRVDENKKQRLRCDRNPNAKSADGTHKPGPTPPPRPLQFVLQRPATL